MIRFLRMDINQDYAIRAEGLGKTYVIGSGRNKHDTLRDLLSDYAKSLIGGYRGRLSQKSLLWALKDVTLQIRRGENVGLIGLNGAGKSTLLKVLSRITEPSAGRAEIHGRVGSLLEVGAGFHSELTGRENTYLYGAILGMSKAEISRKFDSIVDFAEIKTFMDTPVKRYSSGMYVRLAFSVAAHLEPEILLLDEILAVGDLPFQRKCMEFASQLQRKNTTIVFVSHNMFSIKTMCKRVIYLKRGQIDFDGPTDQGIARYEKDCRLSSVGWMKSKVSEWPIYITRTCYCLARTMEARRAFSIMAKA
jgi:lipopolysaccharide transport system ATP-binding protein